uniref:Uncharacterized protein n=1 Tax=Rhizophora mucronata TaxID=61149 RepID=A0A2P2NIN7_RHIMU
MVGGNGASRSHTFAHLILCKIISFMVNFLDTWEQNGKANV